jgi:hypothetical protein
VLRSFGVVGRSSVSSCVVLRCLGGGVVVLRCLGGGVVVLRCLGGGVVVLRCLGGGVVVLRFLGGGVVVGLLQCLGVLSWGSLWCIVVLGRFGVVFDSLRCVINFSLGIVPGNRIVVIIIIVSWSSVSCNVILKRFGDVSRGRVILGGFDVVARGSICFRVIL